MADQEPDQTTEEQQIQNNQEESTEPAGGEEQATDEQTNKAQEEQENEDTGDIADNPLPEGETAAEDEEPAAEGEPTVEGEALEGEALEGEATGEGDEGQIVNEGEIAEETKEAVEGEVADEAGESKANVDAAEEVEQGEMGEARETGEAEKLEEGEEKREAEHVGTGTEPGVEEAEVDPHAPSPAPKFDKEATATVKFVLMPSGQVITLRCQLGQTLDELRQYFAADLRMPIDVILFILDGRNIPDDATLGDLGVGPNGTIQLEIQSADPVSQPIKPWKPKQEYQMPDVITVRVFYEVADYKDIVVEIERPTRKKPFLGGYRHKQTGVEYHHASAQTQQKQRAPSSVEKFCRDTQTVQQRHRVQQTHNDTSTQMTKIGVYVSNMEDKLVVPGRYTTADEYHTTVQSKVVVIQKYYRRWLAKRYVSKVREDKATRLEWERQEEIRKKTEKEQRIQREFMRRMNPKSKEDFDLLYHALEKWRQEEKARIDSMLTGAERKAALCQLLEQETQLIAAIGRHKLDANAENKQRSISAFLDRTASPKKWRGADGKPIEMDTPYTLRAQQLRDIYNSINMKYLTQDERLDILLTLKHTVKEHDCKLTQEIIELIDREADLLMRGVQESNLEGLRKRIATLFLQYIKTPTFNPEAARLLKVPQDPSTLQKDIYFCSGCNQYLPSTEFPLSTNTKVVGRCRKCMKTDNDSRIRQDFSHYRYMLKNLRRVEESYADGSKIAFLLQESDLRHLVENVWSSQSALSAWDDLYDLVLVRWDRHEEWSPWNCCLFTKEEASAHEKLEDLEEAYGKSFMHKVKQKHTLARNYFARLPGMSEHVQARIQSSISARSPAMTGQGLKVTSAKA